MADRIEKDAARIAESAFGELYSPPRSARSPEDFSLLSEKTTIYVDIKTHFVQGCAGFSMPNLVSIAKLRAILEAPHLDLLYVFVDYSREQDGTVTLRGIESAFVWELDWSMLRIGALGKGQLQIINANNALAFSRSSPVDFLRRLKSEAQAFYARQSEKMRREYERWSL